MKPTSRVRSRLVRSPLGSLLLGSLLLGAGCGEPEPEPRPTITREEARANSRRKRTEPPPPEIPLVRFTFKDASLRKVVLPEFEKQAGVRITWAGADRKLSLRLIKPVPWPDALHLVCQFTNTHLAKDYRGRYLLKDGYGGTLGSTADALAELEGSGAQAGGSRAGGSQGSRSGRAGPGPASSSSGGGGAYRETVENSRASGPQGGGGVEYNDGNSASDVMRKSTSR